MFAVLLHYLSLRFACCFFLNSLYLWTYLCINRDVKHHVYVKRQTWICTTWPSFPFTCRWLFFFSTHKLVVSSNFLSIRIVLSCFYLFIFYVEKFSTWIWRLPFAVYVKLKFSNEISHVSLHKNNVKGMSLCCCHYRISQLEDALKRNQYELEKAAEEQQVI